jgi:PilZ domain
MIAVAYQRASERFEVQTPVMIEDFRTSFSYNGVICNYSADGVYLESAYAPRPGRKLRLHINGAPDIFTIPTYLAEVRWRRYLSENKPQFSFGFGLKYC